MEQQNSNNSDSEYVQKIGGTTDEEAQAEYKREREKTVQLINRMKAGEEKMYTEEEMMRLAKEM